MNKYLHIDEWNIVEEGFDPDRQRMSESIFSLGNGHIGQRGNFEERYDSDSYQASFVGGIHFTERTRVEWWKNGFSRFTSRMPVAADWSLINLRLVNEELDLAHWNVTRFSRRLNMQDGIYERQVEATSPKGNSLQLQVEHVVNMAHPSLCHIKYSVTSINYTGHLSLLPLLSVEEDEEISPEEKVWNILRSECGKECADLWTQTRREDNQVCYAMTYQFFKNHTESSHGAIRIEKERQSGYCLGADVRPGDRITLIKYVAVVSSLQQEVRHIVDVAQQKALQAKQLGWERLTADHRQAWHQIWEETDVRIEGDPAAQQAIRYNIFQLFQTYRGDDPRLNIAPKGFTGEKYGGNTYWNTELCCVPFFLLASPHDIVRNLLLYRYNQLPRAIENARRLGFDGGAALFPQVTNNGDECHSEWEITFEEIHRNNIMVYAIAQHALMTGKIDYVASNGLELMIAVCRFWSQRVSFSEPKQQYVILGVTGPNGYENNVDNNWYTNFSCRMCLIITLEFMNHMRQHQPEALQRVMQKTHFDEASETARWREIIDHLYLPYDEQRGIFVQNDGYLDKELRTTASLSPQERPINQHWSWDRILRSCYIKQSDVLLGLYLFAYLFDEETLRRNFEFYEPMTVHESSLSPFIHAILAARLGKLDKAYEHFMHSARLDLDDYNNEADQGLHITSMPGSWLAIVRGFGYFMIVDNTLPSLAPVRPPQWTSYSFKVYFRLATLQVTVGQEARITLTGPQAQEVILYGRHYLLQPGESCSAPLP